MIFCTKCGTQLENGLKFCTSCGATVEAGAPETSMPSAAPMAQGDSETGVTPRKKSRITMIFLSSFLIASMLFGWITLTLFPDGDPFGGMGMESIVLGGLGGMAGSMTIHDFANTMGAMGSMLREVEREMERDFRNRGWSQRDIREEMGEIRDATAGIRTASRVATVVRAGAILSTLALVGFLYLMLTEHKRTLLVGQVGAGLAVLTSLICVVAMFAVNSGLQNIEIDRWTTLGDLISVRASIWVYITLALGVLAFLLINQRKAHLTGGEEER